MEEDLLPLEQTTHCWNCRYAVDADEYYKQSGCHQATTANYLLCRRYPPFVPSNGRERFPQVSIRNICGEYSMSISEPRERTCQDT